MMSTESAPLNILIAVTSTAAGLSSSPPIDPPSSSTEPAVMREYPAASSSGISTGPTTETVLVWLTIAELTKNATAMPPGTSAQRTCRNGPMRRCTRCASQPVNLQTYANPIAEQIGTTEFGLLIPAANS